MNTSLWFKEIPNNSKLLLIGDLFKQKNREWRIIGYFLTEDRKIISHSIPIDALPILTMGSTFPQNDTDRVLNGFTGRFIMPPNCTWKKLTYSQIPASLQRMGTYKSELKNQTIYMFHTSDKTYWLPAIELARRLHFCSSEIVRTAICEGTTHSFGRAIKTGWEGQIDFLPHIPVAYLNSPEYRKYFAWLMFDQVAKDSFSSIFTNRNRNSRYYQDHERWTFDFSPPGLEGTEVAWAGFTDRERKNCFIREIRSISGIKAPSVDTVWFNHPDDKISSPSEDQPTASNNEKPTQLPEETTVDIEKTPKVTNRHKLVRFNKAGLHFDLDICTKRCPRYMMQAPTENKNDTEEKQENEVIAVKQGDETGNVPRADFMVREDQDLLESIDKFDLFQKLLAQLQTMNPFWVITHSTGQVPRGTCRKLHKIGNRFREYLFATVQIDEDTKINILEIELSDNKSLSTLFFRPLPNLAADAVVEEILESLMSNSIKWQRKEIVELTISRTFLEHPNSQVKEESDALNSWIRRAEHRISIL